MVSLRKAKKAAKKVKERWRRVRPPQPKPIPNSHVIPCQEMVFSDMENMAQSPDQREAAKPPSSPHGIRSLLTWFRSIGAGSLALGGLGMIQSQFFWTAVGLVYFGLVLLFIDLQFEHFARVWKVIGGLVFLALIVLFSMKIVIVPAPFSLSTMGSKLDYSRGTAAPPGGIAWRSIYTELDLMMTNPTDGYYDNIDMFVRPDLPVAAIAQLSNLSDVSFENKRGLNVKSFIEQLAPTVVAPETMSFLATNDGYKVHCGRIPPNSTLTIVMAIVDFKKPLPAKNEPPTKPGEPIRIYGNPLLESFRIGASFANSDGTFYYWFGLPNYTGDYLLNATPKSVLVSGLYTASNRRRGITKDVNVWWGAENAK